MKSATRFLLTLTTVAAFTATACGSSGSSSNDARVTAISKLKGDAASGKTLYVSNCNTCHGGNARSGSAAVNLPAESATEAYGQILNGGGGMQSFSSYSDQQIADVWAYVLTLK